MRIYLSGKFTKFFLIKNDYKNGDFLGYNSVLVELTYHLKSQKLNKKKKNFKMKLFIFAVICVLHIANAMPENRVESTESSQSTEVNNTYIFGEKTDYDNIMSTTISRNAVEDTVLEEIVTFPFVSLSFISNKNLFKKLNVYSSLQEGMYNPHVKVKCVIHND